MTKRLLLLADILAIVGYNFSLPFFLSFGIFLVNESTLPSLGFLFCGIAIIVWIILTLRYFVMILNSLQVYYYCYQKGIKLPYYWYWRVDLEEFKKGVSQTEESLGDCTPEDIKHIIRTKNR
jgi:predicted membrane protein